MRELLLHIPCWLSFFIWGVSFTHPLMDFFSLFFNLKLLFLSGELPPHAPCWLHFYLGSFSYASHVGLIFMRWVSLTHPELASFLCGELLLHIPCWLPFLCGEFLLHIPCWILSFFHLFIYLFFYLGSFPHTSRAGFICIWRVSLTHPVLASFLSGEFLLHIPCWLNFYLGSFSYTSHAGLIFMRWVSLTHPELASVFCGELLLHIPCWLPFLCGEFLLHIPCWIIIIIIFFNLGSFSHTYRAGFICIWGVSLTHPVLA